VKHNINELSCYLGYSGVASRIVSPDVLEIDVEWPGSGPSVVRMRMETII